jgi:membrane-bound lytic murein transglycosylase D
MNFKFYALRAIYLVFVTSFLTNIASATSPDYPEIDETLGKLLVDGMGNLMNDYPETNPDYPTFTDDHYRARFLEMSGAIQYRLTADIKTHIIHRTERYRSATERTLGLSEMYFPIFEEYLSEKNIPHQLKYLPIVESNLNAVAKSHAAAVGLWQFIPGTGKLYGLKVVSYLDERSDTHKASNAAATMLANLYKRYNDWPLALAAYNCGPGRVDKYVRGTNKDFWDIRKYLPRETQMYVPYFMAVAYSYEYHHLHELTAKRLPSDLVLTDSIHLAPGYQTFTQLSKRYKIGLDTLKRLNPGYIKNYIPSSSKLNILVLPARIVANLRNYAPAWHRIMSLKSENPIKCIRRVNSEADVGKLMKAHRFSRNDLLFWNGLPSNYRVKKGDLVAVRKYRVPKDAWPKKEVRKSIQGISIASLKVVGLDDKQEKAVTAPVYVSIKNKKLAQNLSTTSVNPSNRKERSNFGVAPTRTNSQSSTAAATNKNEVITAISQNRTRDRRLRNNSSSSTVKIQTNPTAGGNATTAEDGIASELRAEATKAAKTALATKRVSELSKSIQSKEQAVIKAKSYNTTSVEEVSALSYLNNESEKLKKVRLSKKKDREAKLVAKQEAELIAAGQKAKLEVELAAEKQAKLEAKQNAELAAKAAVKQASKEKADSVEKASAKQASKQKADLAAKAAAKQASKLKANLAAKAAAKEAAAAKAAAKQEAKLQAELAAKAAAKQEAKLQAELAAKAAAEEEAKLQAELAEKAAAKQEAKLQAELAAKAAAKQEVKLQAELAAKAAAKQEAKLQAELAAKAAAKQEVKLQAASAAKAAAKQEAKLQAELAAKAAAKQEAKLQAELAAKAAAKQEAKLQAELAAKAAAKQEAKLQAELAAKAAAKQEVKLQAELAAKAAAKQEAKLQAELAEKAAAKQEAKLQAELAAKAAAKQEAKLQAELAAKAAAKQEAKLQAELAAKAAAKQEAKLQAELAAKAAAEQVLEQKTEKERLVNTYQYHQVKNSETILQVAAKYEISMSDLKALNNISIQTILRKGMELKIRRK